MTKRFSILTLAAAATFVVGVSGAMAASTPSPCPDTAQDETQQDCPWAGVSRELSAAGGKKLAHILKARTRGLYDQIHGERSSKAWHPLWGYSINFDELAHGQIVDPSILKLLYSLSEIRQPELGPGTPDNIQHAGLEHTYGYLFSVLKTSFGYKRSRWVAGEINHGFSFISNPISPSPKQGSLFRNVTYFIGRVAFRQEPGRLALLEAGKAHVDPSVLAYRYSDLKVTRLEEKLTLDNGRTVIIRTDLVPFPVAPPAPQAGAPAPNDTLLVYSYVDNGDARLVTAFPVTASFGDGIMKPETLGPDQPIVTRYNAYIPGVTGRTDLKGTRTVQQ